MAEGSCRARDCMAVTSQPAEAQQPAGAVGEANLAKRWYPEGGILCKAPGHSRAGCSHITEYTPAADNSR